MEFVDWYDATLDAKRWWNLTKITPIEAATLLCQINPLDSDANPLNTSNDETTPEDYIRLKRVFEDGLLDETQSHTLKQWHDIAIKNGLKYHSWIDKYREAIEIIPQDLSKTVDIAKGLIKKKIMSAFDGLYFDSYHWGRNLATPPDWLKECRVAKGTVKVSATWNPVSIAIALSDRGIKLTQLDAVFKRLKDWEDEWQEKSERFR